MWSWLPRRGQATLHSSRVSCVVSPGGSRQGSPGMGDARMGKWPALAQRSLPRPAAAPLLGLHLALDSGVDVLSHFLLYPVLREISSILSYDSSFQYFISVFKSLITSLIILIIPFFPKAPSSAFLSFLNLSQVFYDTLGYLFPPEFFMSVYLDLSQLLDLLTSW